MAGYRQRPDDQQSLVDVIRDLKARVSNIERQAGYREGLAASRPTASASLLGIRYYATDTAVITMCVRRSSPTWVQIS